MSPLTTAITADASRPRLAHRGARLSAGVGGAETGKVVAMSETLTIVVNGQEYNIPNTVQTEPDILRAIQFDPNQYALYWNEDVETLGEDQRAGAWEDDLYDAPPVVVSEGDEFVVIPKTTNGGA